MNTNENDAITKVVVTICNPSRTLFVLELDKAVKRAQKDHVFYDENSNVLSLKKVDDSLEMHLVLDQTPNTTD